MKLKALVLSLVFSASALSSAFAADSSINAPLKADQIQFVSDNAPDFITPNCDMKGYDNFCALNYDGDWDASNNYPFDKNLDKVQTTNSTIYYDYYETMGFIVVSYMAYRPWNEVPGIGPGDHLHDTESAILVFKKTNARSTFELSIAEVQPKLVAVVTNAHGEAISAAVDAETAKLLGQLTKKAAGYVSDLKSTLGDSSSRVFKTNDDGRVMVYSATLNHPMYPVFDTDALTKKTDKESTWIISEYAYFQKDLASKDILKSAKHSGYKLVELAPIVLDAEKAKTLFPAKAGQLTICTTTDSSGVAVRTRTGVRGDLTDEDGKPGEANCSYSWGMIVASVKDPAHKKSGDRWDVPHTHIWLPKGFNGLASETESVLVRSPYYEVVPAIQTGPAAK